MNLVTSLFVISLVSLQALNPFLCVRLEDTMNTCVRFDGQYDEKGEGKVGTCIPVINRNQLWIWERRNIFRI